MNATAPSPTPQQDPLQHDLAALGRALKLHDFGPRVALAGEMLAVCVGRSIGLAQGRLVLMQRLESYLTPRPFHLDDRSPLFGAVDSLFDVGTVRLDMPAKTRLLVIFAERIMASAQHQRPSADDLDAAITVIDAMIAAAGPLWAAPMGKCALDRLDQAASTAAGEAIDMATVSTRAANHTIT